MKPEDRKHVHFTVERVHYDKATGKKLSKPKLLKMDPKAFSLYRPIAESKLGFTLEILYEPK